MPPHRPTPSKPSLRRAAKAALIWVRYLQVPIVAGLLASGLAWTAIGKSGGSALVAGAYDTGIAGACAVALVTSLLAFCLWDISHVILKYGTARFGLLDLDLPRRHWVPGIALLMALYLSGPAMAMVACAKVSNAAGGWAGIHWVKWGGAWALVFLGVGALYLWVRSMDRLLMALARTIPFLRNLKTPGYAALLRDGTPDPAHGIGAGHVRQAVFLLLCTIAAVALWFLSKSRNDIPAAVYVMVLFMGVCWLLSAIAFFVWHYRLSLWLPLLVAIFFLGWMFHPPYLYRVEKAEAQGEGGCLPTAGVILRGENNGALTLENPPTAAELAKSDPPPLLRTSPRKIAVATIGGGIHSGAWAVEVLTRLQELPGFENFHRRICAISGTSGGSYGAMHYAHAMYHDTQARSAGEMPAYLEEVRKLARESSLGGVVRAMTYHDLPGYLLPRALLPRGDRGTVMEEQWAANAGVSPVGRGEDLSQVTLEDWGREAARGEMPAILFTSGTEESGRPMIYGSSRVLDWNWNARQTTPVIRDESRKFTEFTVPVVTGARLSSSFPFVSPAAAPAGEKELFRRVEHQIDGGYYDNYGLVALNRWLEDGLTQLLGKQNASDCYVLTGDKPELPLMRLLVIQIRYAPGTEPSKPGVDGFYYQTLAPLTGLYNARVAGQRLRADEQFDIFSRYWERRGVRIMNAAFEFSGAAALSWHLTESQKADLERQGGKIAAQLAKYDKAVEDSASGHAPIPADFDKHNPLGAAARLARDFLKAEREDPRASQ